MPYTGVGSVTGSNPGYSGVSKSFDHFLMNSGAVKAMYDLTKGPAQKNANSGVTAAMKNVGVASVPAGSLTNGLLALYDKTKNGISALGSAINDVTGAVSGTVSGSGSGSGSGTPLASASGFTVRDGKVQFKNKDMQAAMNMINQISASNNAFSAEQAQKQMDFQKMMSDTAHQREVADLQAAGLNPVLSAGGTGASTPSGAIAQTDDSNTRLIAELAYSAIEAVSNTAVGVAGATSSRSGLLNNPFVRSLANGFTRQMGYQAAKQVAKFLF